MEYMTQKNFYLGISNVIMGIISSGIFGMAISKGKLEEIAMFGGLTLMNSISAIGNLLIYKKDTKLKIINYQVKEVDC